MSMIQSDLLLGQEGGAGYAIERSLRFNSSDSAYLSRTPASAGNRKTWTWAGWVKLSSGTRNWLFSASETVNSAIEVFSDGRLYVYHGGAWPGYVGWSGVLRDFSAWYHILVAVDTTQATAANRIKAYINGNQISFDVGTQPAQNHEPTNGINSASLHNICRHWSGTTVSVNCYLADVHFIDGQALTPSSFTEVDATTGQLVPKAYSGTYGTNGFHLPFSDNSTAAALGTDTSGNSNTWTVNNISVAAGAGNDSLVDTPTSYGTDTGAGGEVRGNYCTWNPLANSAAQLTYANGNLDLSLTNAASYALPASTIGVSSGKWYWETTITSTGSCRTGILKEGSSLATFLGSASTAYAYASGGYKANNNNNIGSGYSTYTNGDIIGVALDLDNGKIYFSKNGTWQESGNPATQTNPAYTGLSGTYFASWGKDDYVATSCVVNFGQRPFAYTAPSGFKALCDTNLPAPVVAKPSEVMDVALYTGNGTSQTISGLGFSPDFVWIKERNSAENHQLQDIVRGATNRLFSNLTAAESADAGSLTSFNSDGFSLGDAGNYNGLNDTYVAWTWDAGSSTVTNTQGSITSSVRANPSSGFSIVGYTGTGSSGSLGHGLNVKPQLIIVKSRTQARDWLVYHSSYGATQYMTLNGTGAAAATSSAWNNTEPTSTVFTIGNAAEINTNGSTNIAYCFSPVAGYSSFGSYTGNGSADGPFVYTGFRPRWVMIKRSDSTASWHIYDTARGAYNVVTQTLAANESTAESGFTSGYDIDLLSNGFKPRTGPSNAINTSGGAYVWAAFAESPFQYARAR